MGQILVRGIADEAKQRLRERAKLNGRSLEAEVRAIIVEAATEALPTQPKVDWVDALLARQATIDLTTHDWEQFDRSLTTPTYFRRS